MTGAGLRTPGLQYGDWSLEFGVWSLVYTANQLVVATHG